MSRIKPEIRAISMTEVASLPAVDFLLLTAVDVERDAVLKHFEPAPQRDKVLKILWNESAYYLGRVGQYVCILLMCDMGATGRGGSTLATARAIDRFKPSGVIMVGIAFGKDKR